MLNPLSRHTGTDTLTEKTAATDTLIEKAAARVTEITRVTEVLILYLMFLKYLSERCLDTFVHYLFCLPAAFIPQKEADNPESVDNTLIIFIYEALFREDSTYLSAISCFRRRCLYYFNARYYDPYTARFITIDPIKDGSNWYAYCSNNPLKFVDPDGLKVAWYDTSNKMNNAKWAKKSYGKYNTNPRMIIGSFACDLTATTNITNEITGKKLTPLDTAHNKDYVSKTGVTYHDKILQKETGDSSLHFKSTKNNSNNPNAVKEKLIELEKSDNEYLLKGIATIQYESGGKTKTSRHVVQITGAEIIDNSQFRNVGMEVPDLITLTVEGTSTNDKDRHRKYTLDFKDWDNRIFKLKEIQYVEKPNETTDSSDYDYDDRRLYQ